MKNRLIQEVILVEGKNDTNKIKKIFPNIQTLETNGFDLNKDKIELIKVINDKKGVICLLDPDYMGKKIRNKLIKEIPNLKHAFITLDDIDEKSKKKGIAEASDESIRNALLNFFSNNTNFKKITWNEYLNLNLNNKNKRIQLCNKLKIPYYNHKQLFNILNIIGLDFLEIKKELNE